MTRASSEQTRLLPWYAKAGAASSIVPLSRWVSPTIFALKNGGYGIAAGVTGIDEESLTDQELESRTRALQGALRGLPEGSCLYQYSRVLSGYEIPRRKSYGDPVLESFVSDRLDYLGANAGFRRIDLFWCLTIEPSQANPLEKKPKDAEGENIRRLATLRKTASMLEAQLSSVIGLRVLDKAEAFPLFAYLFNLEPWAEYAALHSDSGLDRQIVRSPIAIEGDHLRVGKRFVQMFTLMNNPEVSRPCQFAGLMTLDCDSVLCTTWRPKSAARARTEISQQEKFISFFKVGVMNRVMSGRDTASLESGAGARAAEFQVDDLGEVMRSLDKTGQGEFTMRLLLAAKSREELHETIPAVHRIFVEARAQVMEESLGNLSAFYTMFPGNGKFNIFPLWLSEDHNARLASVYAPSIGHPHSDDLDSEYLNVFETRSGTPFFQDSYVNGVKVAMILGPTGSGKSVHNNQHVAMERKYNGFTYIFDIGGSYESVVELYGGRVDRVGKDGPRVNPFSLEPTEDNLKFLYSFVKLLLTNSGAELEPEAEDVVFSAVRGMYQLDSPNRRLSNLLLPKHLNRFLSKWTGSGVYAAVFDNVHDELELGRIQCFDFQGIGPQDADLIEPLMVWLLRRIDAVLYDPANLGVPKHIVIEELFSSMKNRQLLETALASIKTVRKNLGGVTLIGQSANDLGENADTIVNSCTSFLFLPDATFNRAHYGELFKLTDQQLDLFESLQQREALYIRRDGLTKVITLNLDKRSYAKFSTRPKDRARRARLVEQYGFAEGIERFAQDLTA